MKVTFDSNAWQPAVRPDLFPKDPRNGDFHKINSALKSGSIEAFISETCGTLEAIGKATRSQHFGTTKGQASVKTTPIAGSAVSISSSIGPDHSQHPGLHPIMADRIRDALSLGVRLLSAPRIGMPRPPEFLEASGGPDPAKYAQMPDPGAYLECVAEVSREIESRGVGYAIIRSIARSIETRSGISDQPLFSCLAMATDTEQSAIGKAVAEWADGDSMASHVASGADYFCTEDQGKSAPQSVLDDDNRQWAQTAHGVRFVTLSELAAKLP